MISVLLPYKNAERTLAEAMASILQERDEPLELVAVDDGSQDRSRTVVETIARGDARVVPISSPGCGIVDALSCALAHARGEWIARMDADDVSLPTRLAKQRARLERDEHLAVIGTQVEGFPIVGAGLAAYLAWQNAIVSPRDHANQIFVESPLCHPSVMMRRSALSHVGGYRDGPFPEDYDLWLRLDAAGFALAKIAEPLLRWRHAEGRATFSDPRCSLASFTTLRAEHLVARLGDRPFAIWGAGKTGRRLARALANHGRVPTCFIDIDPRKVGRTAQSRPIVGAGEGMAQRTFIVVAVGARGARDIVRARLTAHGLVEGVDHLCAA